MAFLTLEAPPFTSELYKAHEALLPQRNDRNIHRSYLLSCSFCLTPYAQTPSKVKPSVSAAKEKQHPRGQNSVGQRGHFTQTQLLRGTWSECSDCNFDFSLKGNQVIFYDPGTDGKQEVVHWEVSTNKLSFMYKGGLVVIDAIIKLTKDSLVLYRRDKVAGVAGYSRFVRLK